MKFTFDKKSFETIINHLSLIVAKDAKAPFSKVRIESKGHDVFLYTTDNSNFFTFYCENVKVISEGEVLTNCLKLKELLKKIETGRYTFEKEDLEFAVIYNDDSRFTLNIKILDNDDPFPIFEVGKSDLNFLIPSNELKTNLEKTIFCTRDEPSRYQMNGILINGGLELIEFVSTDTKRLSIAKFQNNRDNSAINCMIDPDFARALVKILPKDKEVFPVLVQVFEKTIQFNINNCVLSTEKIEGIFPDYLRAIPSINAESKLLSINRGKLLSTLRKSIPFIPMINYSVVFKLEQNLLTIEADSGLGGCGRAEFKINVGWAYDRLEMSFNPDYFIEAFEQILDEPVDLIFTSHKHPVLIITKDGFRHLIMPVLARD